MQQHKKMTLIEAIREKVLAGAFEFSQHAVDQMKNEFFDERFVEQRVNYALEVEGLFIIVENVPARVSERTGERLFSPETVESLQRIVWEDKTPSRSIETPIFEYPGSL